MALLPRKVVSGSITGLSYRFKDNFDADGGVATSDWFALEPNSYTDFGGEVVTVTRNPISRSRQRKKGTVVDFDASGGINHDFTQHQLTRLLQTFFYAAAFEKPTTAALNTALIPITAVVEDVADTYVFDNAPDQGFIAGHLVLAAGFDNAGNNGVKLVSATSATAITTTTAGIVDETPSGDPTLKAVGFQFAVGDITIDAQADKVLLACTLADFTDLGLHPGEWIFVGGDAAGLQFAGNTPGYARISVSHEITATQLVLDKTTWTAADDTAAAKTIQIFFGDYLRNMTETEIEAAGDIQRYIMDIERTLGFDGVGIQSQILADTFANALTYTQPLSEKITTDLTFVALNEYFRTGTEGLLAGTRQRSLGEAAYNSSTCLVRARMSLVTPGTINPTAMFAYVQSIELTIENGVTAVKAQGDIGGIDTVEGDFAAGGSATVYFSRVDAVEAVRDYSDVTFDVILAQRNAGYVIDLPLLGLGNGRLNVAKDEPITVPLGMGAFENEGGYTASYTNFHYLPEAAMPVT